MTLKEFRFFSILLVGICSFSAVQSQTVFRGKILDETTQAPIEGAKVGINDQGVGVLTKANGNFNYRKYHKTLSNSSILQITAPGYTPIEINQWDIRKLFNKSSKIVMTPAQGIAENTISDIKNLAVFWDVSISSKRADFEREWNFVQAYLKTVGDATVELIAFSERIVFKDKFKATSSMENVKDRLRNLPRTGGTDFSILEVKNTDAIVLVSDGNAVLGELQTSRDVPIYAITSVARADHDYLKSLAAFTSGSYISLAASTYNEALDQIVSKRLFKKDVESISQTLKGKVVNDKTPVQGARITIKGDLEVFESQTDGSFSIPAEIGDILQINHFGMYSQEMVVSDLEPLTINMKTLQELLEEVVIKGKKRLKDENKANTGFGERSKDQIGTNINTLLGSEISSSAQSIQDALRGRFAGVRVNGFGQDATVLVRDGNSTLPPIWVVDGAIFREAPNFIDPQSVSSVSIVKSLMATSRYGNIANGGAIIVNSKSFDLKNGRKIVDQALVKGNDYEEKLDVLNLEQLAPDYIKQLKELPKEEQYARFEALLKANESNASFFIDMALYFQEVDREKAAMIRSNLVEMAHKNGQVLRVAAYLYDAAGDPKTSLKLYERVALLVPREAQSYRDLARAYNENGFYDRALELYINMLGEQILGVNFKNIDIPLSHELLNLTARHGDQLDMSRLPDDYKGSSFGLDLRMTLEYSDKEAPFEFQFISPANKYYKFNHTLLDNRDRLQAEEKNGFQMEEFVVDDAEHGLWKVNLEYLGDETREVLPNYIKFTVYWDYGTNAQRNEVIVLKLTPDIKKGQFYEFLL